MRRSIIARRTWLAVATGLVLIVACAPATPSVEPPTITKVGLVEDARFSTTIQYTFADGSTLEVNPSGYRDVGPQDWSGRLVVLGYDAEGQFVASYLPQGGLPDDCYVENQVGTEWGDYIEIRGVLWSKADAFAAHAQPAYGAKYATGTRFCFNTDGEITSTIGL